VLRISPYQKLSKVQIIVMKKGSENDQTYGICIVSLDIYLHSSILTYLLIIISSSLL
jgi:hypothetical protein